MKGLLEIYYRLSTTSQALAAVLAAYDSAAKMREVRGKAKKLRDEQLAKVGEQRYIHQILCNGFRPMLWKRESSDSKLVIMVRQELA